MKTMFRMLPILAVAALLAGCQGPCQKIDRISAPALTAGGADFTTYVAAGTSISAGYQSGALVDRHQIYSFPAIFARQIGKTVLLNGQGTFSEPTIDKDGIGTDALGNPVGIMKLVALPDSITTAFSVLGAPNNLAWPHPYSNLGVPGALMSDFAGLANAGAGYFPAVARGQGSIRNLLLAQAPTFVTLEYGANEVLGYATAGTMPSVALRTLIPAMYVDSVKSAVRTLHAQLPNTKIVLFTIPDVTSIPFATTLPAATVSLTTGLAVPLIGTGSSGSSGPLTPGKDLVTLKAAYFLNQGYGIPVGGYNFINPAVPGNGLPLPNAVVLGDDEKSALQTMAATMNDSLVAITLRTPYVALVDLHGLLADVKANGVWYGATHYTSDFIAGGLFSLDGVHPSDMGHVVICNALVDAVNARFGSTVPRANPADYAHLTSFSARPTGPATRAAMLHAGRGDLGLAGAFPQRY